jgi:hypothetical protein
LEEFNIALYAHVYSSPSSPWHTFMDKLYLYGNTGSYNKFMDAEWEVFMKENHVVCSEEIVINNSDHESK